MKQRKINKARYCKAMVHDVVNLLQEGRCSEARAVLVSLPVPCPSYTIKRAEREIAEWCGSGLRGHKKRKRK